MMTPNWPHNDPKMNEGSATLLELCELCENIPSFKKGMQNGPSTDDLPIQHGDFTLC